VNLRFHDFYFFMINDIEPYSIVVPKILFIKNCTFEKSNRNKKWFVKETPIIRRRYHI